MGSGGSGTTAVRAAIAGGELLLGLHEPLLGDGEPGLQLVALRAQDRLAIPGPLELVGVLGDVGLDDVEERVDLVHVVAAAHARGGELGRTYFSGGQAVAMSVGDYVVSR